MVVAHAADRESGHDANRGPWVWRSGWGERWIHILVCVLAALTKLREELVPSRYFFEQVLYNSKARIICPRQMAREIRRVWLGVPMHTNDLEPAGWLRFKETVFTCQPPANK